MGSKEDIHIHSPCIKFGLLSLPKNIFYDPTNTMEQCCLVANWKSTVDLPSRQHMNTV